MLLKAVPSAYSNPFKTSNGFTENTPASNAFRDETYAGTYKEAQAENAVAMLYSSHTAKIYNTDIAYSGYDTSSLPKCILNKVSFNFQIQLFDAPNKIEENGTVKDLYFAIYSGDNLVFKGDLTKEYNIGTNYGKYTFSVDLTDLVTLDDLKDIKFQIYLNKRYKTHEALLCMFGSSLNIDYTPLHELHIPTSNFIAPFKHEPITYSTADSYGWNITKAYSLPDEDDENANLVFPNGRVGDGYFCGFDISGIPEYSPIFEAYFKVRILASSRNSNRYYRAYSSVAELNSISVPTVDGTYIIPIPEPKRELLQDARLVMEAIGTGTNSFDSIYGVELYVAYGDPMYDWVAGYPTDWKSDPNNQYGSISNFANMCDEPDTLDTYSTYNNNSNQYSPDPYHATLINFAYPTLSPDAKIKKVRFRTSFSGSKDTYKAYDSYQFIVYLDNIKLCESQTFSMNSVPLENYLTPIYVTITSDELNLKYSDIPRLRVEIAQDQSFGSTNKVRFYGAALDLFALTDNARPEWYPIIETIVKSGNMTLDFTAAKPSQDVTVNEAPNTEGYIGNLYNDDLNDYAEFNYTPVPDDNGVMPEDKPEFETIDLGVIRIDSPELTSLGVPGDAVITNIKLTKESLKHCTLANPSAELALYINDNKYDAKGFNISTSFTKTTYDTGKISIPKLEIRNDKAYFMLKWNSLNTPFTFKVKYLLWDITYELGGKTFTLQFAQENIDKMVLGQAEVKAVYAGALKIYG
jgi:hypothetical protein